MNTYGTSSPWTSDSDTGEAAGEDPGYAQTYPDETGAEPHGRHEGDQLEGDQLEKEDPAAAGSAYAADAAGEPGPADDVGSAGVPADAGIPDTTGTAAMTDGTGDGAPYGAFVEDVVVVESVHTGDQSSADVGMPAASGTIPGVGASGTVPGVGDSGAEWSEIKALFVDDPGASVQRASALVERAVDGFMSSLRQRQDTLSSWQEGDAAGTEDLRVALRGYRGLFDQLEQMSGRFQARNAGQALGEPSLRGSASGT